MLAGLGERSDLRLRGFSDPGSPGRQTQVAAAGLRLRNLLSLSRERVKPAPHVRHTGGQLHPSVPRAPVSWYQTDHKLCCLRAQRGLCPLSLHRQKHRPTGTAIIIFRRQPFIKQSVVDQVRVHRIAIPLAYHPIQNDLRSCPRHVLNMNDISIKNRK